mgnify:FL=1
MSKPANNEFLSELLKTLEEFHKFQLENGVPYNYDTIGLGEWILFNKGIELWAPSKNYCNCAELSN